MSLAIVPRLPLDCPVVDREVEAAGRILRWLALVARVRAGAVA